MLKLGGYCPCGCGKRAPAPLPAKAQRNRDRRRRNEQLAKQQADLAAAIQRMAQVRNLAFAPAAGNA